MADRVDAWTRSKIMASVPTQNTSLEMTVRRALHKTGVRYRLHRRDLPGSPDLVLVGPRIALFVHGCFWHGHGCKLSTTPRSNEAYWNAKIRENARRDAKVQFDLEALGWTCRMIWQCTLIQGIEALLTDLSRAETETKRPTGC